MNRFFFGLRFRLILLVLLAVIPALGLTFYSGLEQRRIVADQAKGELLRLTRFISTNQSQLIEGTRHFLYLLAHLSQVQNCDSASCRLLFANLLKRYPWYLNIGAAYPDGNIFAGALPMAQLINIADRSYFRLALKERKFAIGDYQIGRSTGKPAINFGMPVIDGGGKVKAVVYVALRLDLLNQLSACADLPKGSTVTVINHNGMILAHHPNPEKWIGKSMEGTTIVKSILSNREGVVGDIGIDGVSRLYAFATFGGTGQAGNMYLSIGIPTSVAFAEVDKILKRNLFLLLFIGLIALIATWVGGDLLVLRRLNPIMSAVKRLGRGDLGARTGMTYGKGEFSQLALAFDEMVESLEKHEENRKRTEEALRESEEEARRLVQENTIVAEIGRIISSTLDIQEVYERFAEEVRKLISFDRIAINLINPDEHTLTVAYTTGVEIPERFHRDTFSLVGTFTEEVLRTRKSQIIQEEEREIASRFPGLIFSLKIGLRSMMSVPLISKDEVIGILHLRSIKPNAYTEKDLRLAERVSNQITGAIANAQLFAEHVRAEQKAKSLEEQLRQSQKMEAIGRLAGGVAHDFNNLLTVIKGYSELSLMELKEGDPLRRNIEEIQRSSDRAANLTRQLLAFSRRQILEMKVLDLNSIIGDVDEMLHRIIGEDIELVTLLAGDLGRVKTDRGEIEQVIMNLAVNARDAMSSGGILTIETAKVILDDEYVRTHIDVKPGEYVMLSVSDTGYGMTPEVRERIFEPFFTTKEKGTGLGLSTVYGIVKQSGGNISVHSEPGNGTTFKTYLPRVDEPLEELGESPRFEGIPRGNETILIVEDDEAVRKLAVRVLEKQGYTVLEAHQEYEAFNFCEERKEPVHLILTDVIMPRMNGRQLIESLKEVRQDFKVLYMSGYTDNAIVHHGVLEMGVDFIRKPFTFEGLAKKVREVLDK